MNKVTKELKNKRIKKLLKTLSISVFFSFSVFQFFSLYASPIAFAADASSAAASGGDLDAWLSTFYIWAIGLGGALAVFMIAFAAIDYTASGGDVEKMNGAKEKIVGAVVGLLLLVLTYLIVDALHTEAPGGGGTTTQSQIDTKTGTESGVVAPDKSGKEVKTAPDTPAFEA
ncbi:MAG: hypothetical protein ACD_58C00317G0003 [uncultured bacterium]|nr:MAG: hypothetical protein ACD_58C00317G0003 [uncultured bacterium]